MTQLGLWQTQRHLGQLSQQSVTKMIQVLVTQALMSLLYSGHHGEEESSLFLQEIFWGFGSCLLFYLFPRLWVWWDRGDNCAYHCKLFVFSTNYFQLVSCFGGQNKYTTVLAASLSSTRCRHKSKIFHVKSWNNKFMQDIYSIVLLFSIKMSFQGRFLPSAFIK